jgi:glutaredoxin
MAGSRLSPGLALLPVAILGIACHRQTMGPEELAHFHQLCAPDLASGYVLHPSKTVGLGPRTPAGTPVVIYGASWCYACRAAADYLTMRRIPFVDRDVDKDPAAQAASDRAVRTAGLAPTHLLPVVDIRGTVTLGFLPCELEAAWAATDDPVAAP